ncbi:MAG: type II toxin-antitoxin system RelE/ParE family toxin [Lentisphaerae bacterium]|jgi:addiction module RelE/StbE family toxin|nr:type II toxin-antitoxin system RelE/ParE family toxin [Lentisphaerota bacterium]
MFNVRFTPQAVADLEEIKRYISDDLFNPQAAADLVALAFDKIRTLVSMPQTGARLRTDIPMLKSYRFIQCKNHLVFYRIEEKSISVIRILYARRDYLGLLEPDKKVDDDG